MRWRRAQTGRSRYGCHGLPAKRSDRLGSWLERFGRAWETRNAEEAAALFSEDGSYRETPFDEPLTGGEEIRAHWSSLPKARRTSAFSYEILAQTEFWGIARWQGAYTPADREMQLELDGILLLSLDHEGRCRDFREWSNRREHRPPPAT